MMPADIASRATQLQNALNIIKSHGLNISNYRDVMKEYQQALDTVVSMIHDLAVYLQPEHVALKEEQKAG